MKSIWNIVSAIAGILAVSIAIFVFLYSRSTETKRIEVKLVSRSILVDESVAKGGRPIELPYDGRKVSNFAIMTCRIANVGGQPIRTSDYEKPISLNFSDIQELLSAGLTASEPENLGIKASLNPTTVEFSERAA